MEDEHRRKMRWLLLATFCICVGGSIVAFIITRSALSGGGLALLLIAMRPIIINLFPYKQSKNQEKGSKRRRRVNRMGR